MMPQRNNFRGRPDNRFKYNPQGGRGGWNRPPGPSFQQKRELPQAPPTRPKQQVLSKPNTNSNTSNKPSVNETGNNAGSPIVMTATTPKVQPLMKKDIPSPAKQQTTQSPASKTPNQNRPSPIPAKTVNSTPTLSGTDSGKDSKSNQGHGTPNRSHSGTIQSQSHNREQQGNQGRGHQHDRRHTGNQHQPPRHDGGHNINRGGQGRFHGGEQQQPPQHMQQNIIEIGENLFAEEKVEKKFTGRCRLFIGNLPNETTDEEFKKMFDKFGEINEVFLNKQKMFGFIRLDTRLNAEAAKNELDGATFKGRVIRVRFAAHGAALKVKNLAPVVSNELLEEAFVVFGEVERAIVIVDDRGKSTAEGIVEFARKPAAQAAIKKIKEGVFLLTASTRPITVEPLEQKNDEDGLPEKNVPKTPVFYQEREGPPRFAQRNSFEFEWGLRWKQLAEEEEGKRVQLEAEIHANREKLLEEVELARHDYHTMQMRQELLHRQKELERLEEQRKDLEARRHGMQRQREERFPPIMNQDPMMRQRQVEEMQGRGESMDMQQVMRQEEMNRREGGGGGQPRTSRFDQPPGAGPGGFNGNVRNSMPPGGGIIGSPTPGQQVGGAVGGNFGGPSPAGLQSNLGGGVGVGVGGPVGGGGGVNNPRPLMDEMREMENREAVDRRAEAFGGNPKRPRRF